VKAFVTGTAGFIGFHLARRLIADGHTVMGFDGLTPYYDVRLKQERHAILAQSSAFHPVIGMLENKALLRQRVGEFAPEVIVHLAAQAGVRDSSEQADSYIASNVVGTFNLLEAAKAAKPKHLLFASTSSVYGGNEKMPFAEGDHAHYPVSLYAATKKAGEALTHAYAHLNAMPTTCFRFFTVYGPYGRPDMAALKFIEAIEAGRAIEVYNEGRMRRDFTCVGDLIEAVVRLTACVPEAGKAAAPGDSVSPVAPWRVVNIAAGAPTSLPDFITAIEAALGRVAVRTLLPMQAGDVETTWADPSLLKALTGYLPATPLDVGVRELVEWYRSRRDGLVAPSV
jgi:UDP-glucuronate 4-epimerase